MSEFDINPLAAAVRELRSAINQALANFDEVTGGSVAVDINSSTIEVTTVADPVRRYRNQADVRSASVEVM